MIKLEDSQRLRRSDRKVLESTKWEEVALCEQAIGEWGIWDGWESEILIWHWDLWHRSVTPADCVGNVKQTLLNVADIGVKPN